jgi:hypothetical protein
MASIEFASEQIQNDLLQNIELQIRVKKFVYKTRCLFVWFILQSVLTSVIRFFTPDYHHESNFQKEILYAYIPLQFLTFTIELVMIWYFYNTSMQFVAILQQEENISKTRARILFGTVTFILFLGKVDFYVDETILQVQGILLDRFDCKTVVFIQNYLIWFHNLMPIVIGLLILYIVWYMAKA